MTSEWADQFVAVDIQGIDTVKAVLNDLRQEINAGNALDEVARYLQNVFRQYAPYRHISRAEAWPGRTITFQNGRTIAGWFSLAQFRTFWKMFREGTIQIPYNRTQTLATGWKILGHGYNAMVANETPYAAFVQNRGQQSKLIEMEGWQTAQDLVDDRAPRIKEIMLGRLKRGGA